MHLVARSMREPDGTFEYIGAIQDITRQRMAEAKANDDDVRMRKLQNELAHANRLATVGQLSAALSHEVRQPLGSVVASGKAGMNWLAAEPPDLQAANRALERILSGAHRAAEILDRTKMYARTTGLVREPVAINSIIADTVALLSVEARQRDILIEVDLEETVAMPMADRVQVQQVVMNLTVNAMDALTETEGVKRITVRSRNGCSGVEVTVADTGPGVDPADRDGIFEAFHTTKTHGLGMGLAICRSIVEAHGGRIGVDPIEPRGCAFNFDLPIRSVGET
jgi:C4-dicarboxylate-specific signal transduction histidine kinase